ncbi:MAG: type II toxin-antitoxin system PemK/MazF family toxin [Oscillospiraceae bacterium]|nr:type II toxin-antitoxin system PemK/MazF family toxin [Oscillospiraceae bacterium]
MDIKRGDVYYADLSPVMGEEEGGIRPVLVISNDNSKGTIIIAAITSKPIIDECPAVVPFNNGGLFPNTILLNHLRTIDKRRLKEFVSSLNPEQMQEINKALCISLGL